MENHIPSAPGAEAAAPATGSSAPPSASAVASAIDQAVERSTGARRAVARAEVERLIAAALALIEREGSLEPKVSAILAEAGLSNQAFYRHFESKHALLVAVLDQGIRSLADYLGQRMSAATSPADAVRAWIRGMAAQASHPDGARATRPFALARGRLAESFPAEVARSATQLTAPLRRALEEARSVGAMPEVDPERDAETLYLLTMGWVEARLLEERSPDAGEIAHLEAFVLAGLERGSDAAHAVPPAIRTQAER